MKSRRTNTLASLVLGAHMIAAAQVFPSNAPKVPLSPHIIAMDRRTRKRLALKGARSIGRHRNEKANRANRQRMAVITGQQQIINSMTNWQRVKWQRAGRKFNIDNLKKYAAMLHHKRAAA